MSTKEFYTEESRLGEIESEVNNCQVWFRTQTEFSEGQLTVTIFKIKEWFELEISRSLAFETKRFVCASQDQVWVMIQQIMEDPVLYFRSLSRTGFVRLNGERCLFKVGDQIVCQSNGKSEQLQLASPLRGEGYVALIDKKGCVVNELEVEQIYRSLYGAKEERRIPLRLDLKTGKMKWGRVLRLKTGSKKISTTIKSSR